jgi:phage head maturation protease
MNEKRFIDETVQVETRNLEDGTTAEYISGRGIVFNSWSKPLTMELKSGQRIQFVERIEKRAIDGVDLSQVESMVDHKILLGKRSKGTMEIDITDQSVNYSVKIPNTTVGNDAKENIRNGNLEGSSFQFGLASGGDSWDKSVTPYQRTISKFSFVSEMGPVSRPAYGDTTAALRSLEDFEKEQTPKIDYNAISRKLKLHKLKEKRAMVNINDSTITALLEDCENMCEYSKYSMMEDSMYKSIDACDLFSDALDLITCMIEKKSKYLADIKDVTIKLGQDVLSTLKGNAKYMDLITSVTQSIQLIQSI